MNESFSILALGIPTESSSTSDPRSDTASNITSPAQGSILSLISTAPMYLVADNGLKVLQDLLGVTRRRSIASTLCDAVLIAIDFENITSIKDDLSLNSCGEVGLAILDTTDLMSVGPEKLISTFNFASGSPKYQERASRRFLFVDSVAVGQKDMLRSIESLIPRERNVVLAGHAIENDLRACSDPSTSISVMFTKAYVSLRHVLLKLKCPFTKLRCGGNDANFTLRASLFLAAQGCSAEIRGPSSTTVIEEAALSALPRHADSHPQRKNIILAGPTAGAAKKKMKRFELNRKHQLKTWDTEMQERIRAERAARKSTAEVVFPQLTQYNKWLISRTVKAGVDIHQSLITDPKRLGRKGAKHKRGAS